MILIDTTGHLASTEGPHELHPFARLIGLRREWYQDHPTHPHYDCTTASKRRLAVRFGAVQVGTREMLYRMGKAGQWTLMPGTLEMLEAKFPEVTP